MLSSPASSPPLPLRIVLLAAALLGLVGAALELPEFPLSRNVEPDARLYQIATAIRPLLGPALAVLALILAAAALALLPWRRALALAGALAVIPIALSILFFAFYFALVRMPD